MEYEISDEGVLFDDSTNPSLEKKRERAPAHLLLAKVSGRKAVPIPEEEQQLA